jgi:hypothetical protein
MIFTRLYPETQANVLPSNQGYSRDCIQMQRQMFFLPTNDIHETVSRDTGKCSSFQPRIFEGLYPEAEANVLPSNQGYSRDCIQRQRQMFFLPTKDIPETVCKDTLQRRIIKGLYARNLCQI